MFKKYQRTYNYTELKQIFEQSAVTMLSQPVSNNMPSTLAGNDKTTPYATALSEIQNILHTQMRRWGVQIGKNLDITRFATHTQYAIKELDGRIKEYKKAMRPAIHLFKAMQAEGDIRADAVYRCYEKPAHSIQRADLVKYIKGHPEFPKIDKQIQGINEQLRKHIYHTLVPALHDENAVFFKNYEQGFANNMLRSTPNQPFIFYAEWFLMMRYVPLAVLDTTKSPMALTSYIQSITSEGEEITKFFRENFLCFNEHQQHPFITQTLQDYAQHIKGALAAMTDNYYEMAATLGMGNELMDKLFQGEKEFLCEHLLRNMEHLSKPANQARLKKIPNRGDGCPFEHGC